MRQIRSVARRSLMLATRILAALPQTQCTRCGYPDCAGYANAIAQGHAGINQCPPGGAEGIARLAAVTGHAVISLNPENGVESPRVLAVIDENWCIGCTLCIEACPADAILGSNKLMHTVIESYCTGCELCIPVCPVDCIQLENLSGSATGWNAWSSLQADWARARYKFNRHRRGLENSENFVAPEEGGPPDLVDPPVNAAQTYPEIPNRKSAVIEAAIQRARANSELEPGAK